MTRSFILSVIVLVCISSCTTKNHTVSRIPVLIENKFGYVDTTGKMAINPLFYAADTFSEGLAAVRENGLYGYIDEEGQYIIHPEFEYATAFSSNRARVWKNGQSWFINKKNEKIFKLHPWMKDVYSFALNTSIVFTRGGHYALIDEMGKLLTDTNYNNIIRIHQKYFAAYLPQDSSQMNVCLLNTKGKRVIKPGVYSVISEMGSAIYCGGKNGGSMFHLFNKSLSKIYTGFQEDNTATISVSKHYFIDEIMRNGRRKNRSYTFSSLVAFDTLGTLVFESRDVSSILCIPFDSTAIVKFKNEELYSLVNSKGKKLTQTQFKAVTDNSSHNDALIVLTGEGEWCTLNKKGKLNKIKGLPAKGINDISWNKVIHGYTVTWKDEEDRWHNSWLTMDLKFKDISFSYASLLIGNKFIDTRNDSEQCIYNRSGELLFKQKTKHKKIYPLNIDYVTSNNVMVRESDHYKAPENEYRAFVRWVRTGPYALPLKNRYKDTDVITVTNEIVTDSNFYSKNRALKVRISNPFSDTLFFQTADDALELSIEAQDSKGNWKTIVTNSRGYYGWMGLWTQRLYPGYCWEIKIPAFDGGFKTKARIKLQSHTTNSTGSIVPGKVFYSKPYPIRINKAQFWRDQFYGNEYLPWRRSKTVSVHAFYMDEYEL